jgi:hypothetical protein
MDTLSALVIGIAHYEGLDGWNISEDRTAKDAIAVTESLRKRGVPSERIKLFLSLRSQAPTEVAGVPVIRAHREPLSDFIIGDFKKPALAARNFFFFCSGHGFIDGAEPCLILADSRPAVTNQATYRCLGLDQFRTQLLGMGFTRQLLCINTCQVPAEWSAPGRPSFVDTAPDTRLPGLQQVRFLAAPEIQTAPVENRIDGLSNGFAAAVRACIDRYDWPPNPGDWDAALRREWGKLVTLGLYGVDQSKFKILRERIRKIDRKKQFDFASNALRIVRDWKLARESTRQNMVSQTLLDLHAIESDQLMLLISRLGNELFNSNNDKKISGGLNFATWPAASLTISHRKQALFQSLAGALVDDDSLENAEEIADALAAMGGCIRVVFLEVNGSTDQDQDLIRELLTLWKAIISRLDARSMLTLPLLVVGHVSRDPDPSQVAIDTARYYHSPVPLPGDKRRLGEIQWQELMQWLDDALPRDRHPGRSDLDAEIAKELGGTLIESLQPFRMARLVDLIAKRTG